MRCLKYIPTLLVLAGGALRADTIVMNDTELRLEGKVQKVTDEYVILLVHEESGRVYIPRGKIKSIEYDVTTQLAALKDDDFAGRYKVGVWAMDKAMYEDAVKIFEDLKGKEGVGPDMLKLLARAYDKRNNFEKAFENYSDYQKLHADDAEVNGRIAELQAKLHPPDKVATPDAPKANKVYEGLEADGSWVAEQWGIDKANPARVSFTTDAATGNKMIAVVGDGGPADKTPFSRTGQPLDLSDSQEMVFKINHNAKKPIMLAAAFINSQGEFHETPQIRVPPNSWTNNRFKVAGKVFKATRNEFKEYNLELDGKDHISRIVFMVYSHEPFTLYLDAVFFK